MTEVLSDYLQEISMPENVSELLAEMERDVPDDELYGAKEPIAGVYTDGGTIGGARSTVGGAWAWCHVTGRNIAVRHDSGLLIPTARWPDITNNFAEYVAVIHALEALPEGWIGHIYTDSQITLGRFASNWATNGLPDLLVKRGRAAVERLGGTFWHLLDGHPTKAQLRSKSGSRGNPVSFHNVWCDGECTRLMRAYVQKLREQENEQSQQQEG